MKLVLACDFEAASGVDKTRNSFVHLGLESWFAGRNFVDYPEEIFVVLTCREPHPDIKQRVRHSKKEGVLYMDVMLELEKVLGMTSDEKLRYIATELIGQLDVVLKRYRFKNLDTELVRTSLTDWFNSNGITTTREV